MSFLTLGAVRKALWKYAPGANGTFVAYESRTTTTDGDEDAWDAVLNQCVERFLSMGKWRGDTVRARFRVYDNQVTLPSTLQSILGATPIRDESADEDGWGIFPYGIFSEMHEFLRSGPGNPSTCSMYGLVDLGDLYATFRDPSGTFYIKAVSSENETAKTIILKGLDDDQNQIYSSSGTVEGVSLTVDETPGATTSQEFTQFSAWEKSAATAGVVSLYSVDTTSAEETLLVTIPPNKLTSGYHRYRVPDGDWGDTIECLCKRAFVPVVADADIVIPGNIGALKMGLMALQYEDKNDLERAEIYWNKAFTILNSELEQFKGDSILPSVQMQPQYGGGQICNIL